MLRNPLFTVPVFTLLAAADAIACLTLAGKPLALHQDTYFVVVDLPRAWQVHAGAAGLAALLGTVSLTQASLLTRLTLMVFCFILAGSIPVIGILTVAALGLVLRRPSTGGLRPEERFVFGNPEALAARRESRAARPNLTPLAEGFRSMDEDSLCQAILGLKHLRPVSGIVPFLRRFQQDPRTSVQFTAQAVMTGASEELEETARTLRSRHAADPDNAETTLALASTLDQLASWSPPGDTTALLYRRDAENLLLAGIQASPTTQNRTLPLLSRQQLAGDDSAAAWLTTTQWAELTDSGDTAVHAALLESLFQQSRWDDLAAAARLLPPPPGLAEAHAFWSA